MNDGWYYIKYMIVYWMYDILNIKYGYNVWWLILYTKLMVLPSWTSKSKVFSSKVIGIEAGIE